MSEKRPINKEAWRQKYVTISARPTSAVADEEIASGYDSEEVDFPAKYYVVCTNTWPSKEIDDSICMCTYYEATDCETYQEAKLIAKRMNADGAKCPYCGHSHFRIKEGESLKLERKYATRHFFVD